MGKNLEGLTERQKNTINDIRKLLSSKKTFNHDEFVSLVCRAGYKTKVNGDGYLEFYGKNGTKLINEDGIPVILSNQKTDLPPGKYKRILNLILEEIEEYK